MARAKKLARLTDAFLDRGGVLFGSGPYLHVRVRGEGEERWVRVYPPERLRRRLAVQWAGQ